MNQNDQTIIDGITDTEETTGIIAETTGQKRTKATDKMTETAHSIPDTKQETETTEGVYVHKFKTPFEDSGEVYEEIEFNFNALTGADMIKVENEMKLKGIFGEMLEVSKVYQSHVAIRAAAKGRNNAIITVDAFERMPVKDFFKITNKVRDFLIVTGG